MAVPDALRALGLLVLLASMANRIFHEPLNGHVAGFEAFEVSALFAAPFDPVVDAELPEDEHAQSPSRTVSVTMSVTMSVGIRLLISVVRE